jgi:electron transfer flavoprotein beta subunit
MVRRAPMRIVVLVKEVPDTYCDRRLSLETGLADRGATESVLDEIGERSLEVALSFADKNPDTEVVVLSMGPESAQATVRKGLAMGAGSAVQVVDDGLLGADLGLTAEVLAAAVRRTGFDLVVAGNQSTDGSGGMLAAMVAEWLDVPAATNLNSVEITADAIRGERATDGGTAHVTAALPAVISITERLPDARFPNFKGIMAAKKRPFETLSLEDLAIDPDDATASRSIMIGVSEKPPRQAGTKIVDEGDAGQKLAEFLVANRLA